MHLDTEFIRLPLTFDASRLSSEISQFPESDWRPHPQGHPGNSALALISINGDPFDDAVKGPMRATPHFERCPYLRQVLAAFQAVWGRTRLMRLDGNAEATSHADTNYYWSQHTRVHVPIVTDDAVRFLCGEREVHMAAGESWIFDTWRMHNVLNPNPTRRIHLVADTIGSAAFWELVDRGHAGAPPAHVAYDPRRAVPIATEAVNHPIVMSPGEQRTMIDLLQGSLAVESPELRVVIDVFHRDWRAAWARFGESRDGWPLYEALLKRFEASLEPLTGRFRLRNGVEAIEGVRSLLARPAMSHDDAPRASHRPKSIERPVFIVCPPRSGSSLFFETLSQSPSLWTVGGESHAIIEGIPALHPADRRFHSNRLTAADATPDVVAQLGTRFARNLRNRDGIAAAGNATVLRMLEKTPKNSLRVPFLAAAFPDALFVYLYRDMRDTISSMLDAWRSGKFVTYPQLPGWEGPPWSLLLTPGWRELSGKPLAEIVAAQWSTATRYLLDDLEQLAPERWCISSYDALLTDPQAEMLRLSQFLGIDWDRQLTAPLPQSRTTLTAPDKEKWRKNAADLEIALPLVEEVAKRSRALYPSPARAGGGGPERSEGPGERSQPPGAPSPPLRGPSPAAAAEGSSGGAEPFRSVYTPSFPELLARTGSSLLVSTYQSGRLIIVRAVENQLNTHFRAFPSPMGIAAGPHTLSLGTKHFVWHFRNHPNLAQSLDGGRADAAFVPSSSHATGDIRVHEMAWAGDSLIVVNTRFSCLCTLDGTHSFVPAWRPKFVTELVPEDRCHLNGVAVVDGRARYVTALGATNEQEGWRATKSNGGIVIDVDTDEIIATGLSMPHSPRWRDGKLWFLESGEGRLCVLDRGRVERVAEVPGFARGLAFAGRYAFIGLSQVRERVFEGVPVAQRSERQCGIWIVDTRNGSIAGFLRFEDAVQEIFDVQLLNRIRYPELLEPTDEAVGQAFLLPPAAEPRA
jgi:uncharacterized protein (TIGR03032 family)